MLTVGYCPAFSTCGEWRPDCIDLQLEVDAGVYRIVGLNMRVLNPSHGDPWLER